MECPGCPCTPTPHPTGKKMSQIGHEFSYLSSALHLFPVPLPVIRLYWTYPSAISSVGPPHCSSDDVHTHSATARRHGQRSTGGPWRPLARGNPAFTYGCLTYISVVILGYFPVFD